MFFKKMRDQAKEISDLKGELVRSYDRELALKKKITERDDALTELVASSKGYLDEKDSIQGKLEKKETELEKIKKLVREQSEADLLINALIGVGVIKNTDNRDALKEADRLNKIREVASISAVPDYGLGQASGFGSILGLRGFI